MNITYQTDHGILEVEPTGPLDEQDFKRLGEEIAHARTGSGDFNGVLLRAKEFPGYESFSDVFAHSELLASHRDDIDKIAFCTDSALGKAAQLIGDSLTSGQVREFAYDDKDEAEKWLLS